MRTSPKPDQRPLAATAPTAEAWREAANTLLAVALEGSDARAYLENALPQVAGAISADYAALAESAEGAWHVVAETGARRNLPVDTLAEALDHDALVRQADWTVAPIAHRGLSTRALVVHHSARARKSEIELALVPLANALATGLSAIEGRDQRARHTERLETILDVVTDWYRTREMEPLLVGIAEAATSLLGADRASIFLWDRENRVLVARPALGVEGGELRVPDDSGVVGFVVQTGHPRRVRRTDDQRQIDRHVDEQLGYHTHSLLCVPLRGSDGRILGAFETVNKLQGDFTADDEEALRDLAAHAAVALENTREFEQLLQSRRQMTDEAAQRVQFVGQSAAIEALRSTIRRVADTELAILILGDNGTGKEVVAQSLHYLSSRRDQPLIAVNCAAIAEQLLESELFGHEKGAFTDAREARPGKFELASGGTLFLDEIGELSPGGQAKLLRVLEEKIVVRVGGSRPIHTDARLIAATNQDLLTMVREKRFREDLYYRLNVVTLELPPLRERPEDILLLAEHFLAEFCRKARRPMPSFTAEARRQLELHPWPGNVRELRNLMERIAYLSQSERIEPSELARYLPAAEGPTAWVPADLSLSDATDYFQAGYIKKAVERARGNMSQAAKQLGLHRSNLYRKMRQLNMHDADHGEAS